ncbi:MAG TPA: glycosyltransferase [Acidimicrobiales bacterium]|nr:glycosyltransferase [Acidimicrobiales bacterium]
MGELKTVLYVQRYPDGGSITSLLDLVRGLDPTRFRAVVAFRNPNTYLEEFADAGAVVEVLRKAPSAGGPGRGLGGTGEATESSWWRGGRRVLRRALYHDIPAAVQLLRVARRHRVDLIHGNNDVAINRDAVLVAAAVRVPLVNHVRGLYVRMSSIETWIDRHAARRVRWFFFISAAVERQYAPLEVPSERCEVLDNPFDVEELRARPSVATATSLGIAEGDRAVIHVGRLTPWKGQDVLLRALPALLEQHPDVRVVLVGSATDETGREYEAGLRALADDLGIADRVVFAGSRRDIPEVFAVAEVAVHSSTQPEPFGRVIVEAMAAGRPVVAAAEGGVPEIIDDGATGLLVPPDEPEVLALAVGRLLADPARAAAMGERAAAGARERYGLDAHATRIQAAYDRVLRGEA